jgi:RNA polymerase-interacting CarD/CdnL/TRCF family regulator
MVKKFDLNCIVNQQELPISFYVGDPQETSHPIGHQMKYLGQRGVSVPEDVVKSLTDLNEIAKRNRVPFEHLLQYVTDELNSGDVVKNAFDKFNEISRSLEEEKKEEDKNN